MPLDSMVSDLEFPVVVKIDVDGAEMDVLEGTRRLIAMPQVRWIIETHTPALEWSCLAALHAKVYQTCVIPQTWWSVSLPELR